MHYFHQLIVLGVIYVETEVWTAFVVMIGLFGKQWLNCSDPSHVFVCAGKVPQPLMMMGSMPAAKCR